MCVIAICCTRPRAGTATTPDEFLARYFWLHGCNVPFPPGGAGGIIGHLIGPKLTEKWGQPVIVDNRGGAAGSIGSEIAARSAPDGYTLLIVTGSTIILNPIVSKVPFDPIKDFAPVIWTTSVPFVLLLHPSVPARSVKDLVVLAKAKPGALNFGSGGNGSTGHLAGELFNLIAGTDLFHVAWNGVLAPAGTAADDAALPF